MKILYYENLEPYGITLANMLIYPPYYDVISLTSLKITQAFFYYLEIKLSFWNFKIQNTIQITEGSDNGDSDNRDSANIRM